MKRKNTKNWIDELKDDDITKILNIPLFLKKLPNKTDIKILIALNKHYNKRPPFKHL